MDARTNVENRLPSGHVTEGPARAPHRSYSYAMGLTDEQSHQPFDRDAQAGRDAQGAENAAAVVAASGGSTDAALHLPAIAHECGIAFDLLDVAEVFKRTSCIADLKPAGRFVAKDLVEGGSVPLLMKTLLDNGFMHGDCVTVTGCGMAENLKRAAWNRGQDVVRVADRPLMVTGGVVPARCFDGEEACFEVVESRRYREGEVLVIRYEGGSLEVQVSEVEFEKRRAAWQPRGTAFGSGYLWKYAQQVGPARHGAVTHPGGAAEKACYADI